MSTFREEIKDSIYDNVDGNETGLYDVDAAVRQIIEVIEKRIDEKIQYVTNIINNESRLTIQGCQRLKGKKDAYEEMKKEMLKS